MTKKLNIVVGMSGGVDSSVTAYLLKQQGHNVIGVSMSIWDGKHFASERHACYGPNEKEELEETAEICKFLDIPFHIVDCSKEYKNLVLEYFKTEYLSGRTPNPCVKCNHLVKLGILPEMIKKSGLAFDKFATGHYASIDFNEETQLYNLKKGIDPLKDQSYFLYRLSQKQLSNLLFPIGKFNKTEIKKIAKEINLSVHDKEESQDFYCGDYKDLLDVTDNIGDIITIEGQVLGQHKGIWNYTLGQRKGLGIAYKEPLYVINIDKDKNTVIVGTKIHLQNHSFIVEDLNWIALENLSEKMNVSVKIRSAHHAVEATIEPCDNNEVKVNFILPQEAITPGQSAVFYLEDLVLGGGTIKEIIKQN